MSYQVLYRVWRPQNFSELTGQDHIRRTLENAVVQGRISHAYLFTGPRGTGKTSMARILAKSLNCARRQGAEPCGLCESCLSITQGHSLDVLEIDGASNRGIEEIRELKEKIGFMPALGQYKVYIVDEVHMLTTEAFNALLKTLEEPPAHVIFVLATTDPQKMPPTVLSRCQRFDFRKLSYEAIKGRLEEILAGQGRQAEAGALSLIIRQADGGLRDAISLLDQCLSYSAGSLTLTEACDILGLVRQEALAGLLAAVMAGDAATLFGELAALFTQGVDPMQLLKEFAGYCRDLLLMALCGPETDLVSAEGEQRQLMARQGADLGSARLQQILSQADQATAGGRYRGNSRYMTEAFFASLLLAARGQGEQNQSAGVARLAVAAAGGPRPVKAGAATRAATTAPTAIGATTASAGAPTSAAFSRSQIDALSPGAAVEAAERAAGIGPIAGPEAGAANTSTAYPATDPVTGGPQIAPPPTNTDAEITLPMGIPVSSGLPPAQWEQFLQTVKCERIVLHALLSASIRQELRDGALHILFDPEKGRFHKERCCEADNLQTIKEAARQVCGSPVEVICDFLTGKEETQDPVQKAVALFGRGVVKLSE